MHLFAFLGTSLRFAPVRVDDGNPRNFVSHGKYATAGGEERVESLITEDN